MAQPTNTPATPSVLGIQRQELTRPTLISDTSLLWGVWCHPAQDPDPRVVVWYKSEAAAQRYVRYVIGSTWTCACGQPYATHRALEAPTFALQREADRALAQEAAAQPPPDAPAEQAVTFSETMADPEAYLPAPPEPQPKTRPRGPHADRLAKARAAQQAATQPKPARTPKTEAPKDPFEEESS